MTRSFRCNAKAIPVAVDDASISSGCVSATTGDDALASSEANGGIACHGGGGAFGTGSHAGDGGGAVACSSGGGARVALVSPCHAILTWSHVGGVDGGVGPMGFAFKSHVGGGVDGGTVFFAGADADGLDCQAGDDDFDVAFPHAESG